MGGTYQDQEAIPIDAAGHVTSGVHWKQYQHAVMSQQPSGLGAKTLVKMASTIEIFLKYQSVVQTILA